MPVARLPKLSDRTSGVLLHPTSLPGAPEGGQLDAEARAFVDFMAAAGQSWWQTLPLGPVGEGGSPYKSPSAFAGAPTLLAEPDAPVSAAELDALREREAYWLPDWEDFAGAGAGGPPGWRGRARARAPLARAESRGLRAGLRGVKRQLETGRRDERQLGTLPHQRHEPDRIEPRLRSEL